MPINRILPTKRAKMAAASSVGAVVLATTVLIQPWEALRLHSYRDSVGKWTICYGETQGVRRGQTSTSAQCDQRLKVRVERDFYQPLVVCIQGFEKAPITVQASLISLAYNTGPAVVCRSTAAELIRRGQYHEACLAATAFNRAGGSVLKGLVRRRENGDEQRIGEAELCVSGLE